MTLMDATDAPLQQTARYVCPSIVFLLNKCKTNILGISLSLQLIERYPSTSMYLLNAIPNGSSVHFWLLAASFELLFATHLHYFVGYLSTSVVDHFGSEQN